MGHTARDSERTGGGNRMSRPYHGESADEWLGITCPEDCATLSADDYDNEELDDLRNGRKEPGADNA